MFQVLKIEARENGLLLSSLRRLTALLQSFFFCLNLAVIEIEMRIPFLLLEPLIPLSFFYPLRMVHDIIINEMLICVCERVPLTDHLLLR